MGADPEFCQRFECGRAACPYQDLLNDPTARDHQSDGPANFTGQLSCGAGQLGSEHDRGRDAAAIQSFECREAAGFQPAEISVNGGDDGTPCGENVRMSGGRLRPLTRLAAHSRAWLRSRMTRHCPGGVLAALRRQSWPRCRCSMKAPAHPIQCLP